MTKLSNFGLYFITDSILTKKTIIDDVENAVKAGVKIVQYREKNKSKEDMIREAKKIKEICKNNNVLFIVDDKVDVALEVGADGVHLGHKDMPYETARKLMPGKIIGLSAHDIETALNNEKLGADYTAIGPIYSTKTKKDADFPVGLYPIKILIKKLAIPLVAIGGINESNLDDVLTAGAKNAAIISGIVSKDNVFETTKEFIGKINNFNRKF